MAKMSEKIKKERLKVFRAVHDALMSNHNNPADVRVEIADAVGSSLETVRKWEHGDYAPTGERWEILEMWREDLCKPKRKKRRQPQQQALPLKKPDALIHQVVRDCIRAMTPAELAEFTRALDE